MVELAIPSTHQWHNGTGYRETPNWWTNFFFSCGDWREAERVLDEEWGARVKASHDLGEVGTIVFKNEQDATMFLLKWS